MHAGAFAGGMPHPAGLFCIGMFTTAKRTIYRRGVAAARSHPYIHLASERRPHGKRKGR
jgi:hypothetical protein